MGRYIVHLINQGFSPKKANDLLLRARSLNHDAVIRDARVSTKYIEFDTTIDAERFGGLLENLASMAPVARFIEVAERKLGKDDAIEDARSLFNEERYWECHEVLEGVWKQSTGNEKSLLQGIILTCAGFVHSQKNEDEICLSVLRRAMEKLKDADQVYHGIDMAKFREIVKDILDTGKIRFFRI